MVKKIFEKCSLKLMRTAIIDYLNCSKIQIIRGKYLPMHNKKHCDYT